MTTQMSSRWWFVLFLGMFVPGASAQEPSLPKVVLIGDSIRLGYAPLVTKRLEGRAIVVSPTPNGEDSGNVLKNLDEWVIKEKPDVVHINAGLHDLKLKDHTYQVPLIDYEGNLKEIVGRIRNLHALRNAGFDRFEADVRRYNVVAMAVMNQAGIPVNDLHTLIEDGGKEKLMADDGTHYTPAGYEMLAAAVTDYVLRGLAQLNRGKPATRP
jgi:lysophospholipase L1-like esterase